MDFKIPEPVLGKGIFKDGSDLQNMIGFSGEMNSNQNRVLKSQRTAASENPTDQSFGIDIHLCGPIDNEENFNTRINTDRNS